MSFSPSFGTQVAAIMDVLANAAVAEITKLVEDGTVVLRLEMCRRDTQIQELKRSLELMEAELLKVREAAKTRGTEEKQKQTETESQAPCKGESNKETFAVYLDPEAVESLCEPHEAEESHDIGAAVKREPAVELATQEQTGNTATTDICFEQDDLIWPPPVCSLLDSNSVAMQEQTQMFSPLSEQYAAHTNKTYAMENTADSLSVLIKDEVESRPVCIGKTPSQLVQKERFGQTSHPARPAQCIQPASQQAGPSLAPHAQRHTTNRSGLHTEDHIFNRKNQRAKRIMTVSRANHKLFTCPLCNKWFLRISQLEEHKATHQTLKPYRCLECGKSFTQKRRLQTHQSVHTGEKPFSCKICGKMFSRPDNCRRHERFHSGLKPYSCGQCGQNFTVLGNLKMHEKIHRRGR